MLALGARWERIGQPKSPWGAWWAPGKAHLGRIWDRIWNGCRCDRVGCVGRQGLEKHIWAASRAAGAVVTVLVAVVTAGAVVTVLVAVVTVSAVLVARAWNMRGQRTQSLKIDLFRNPFGDVFRDGRRRPGVYPQRRRSGLQACQFRLINYAFGAWTFDPSASNSGL